jgi:Domain of unknown function (DUF4157)
MGIRQFDPVTPADAERAPMRRAGAHEPQVTRSTGQGLLTAGIPAAGRRAEPRSQARALAMASDGRLARAGAALLQLQRQYGNRHVQQVVAQSRGGGTAGGAPALQAKLALGPPSDRYEREADRVARQAAGHTGRDRWEPQEGSARPARVQRRRGTGTGSVDPGLERAVSQARGGGQALPGRLRSRMEQVLGADLGAVRVHTGPRADQLNDALRSRAFTVGGDVFLRRGAYRAGTRAGEELLAHELTHTVQQGASRPRHEAGTPAPPTPAVQRAFGFELELPVLLTRGERNAMRDPWAYTPPGVVVLTDDQPKLVVGEGTTGGFELHVDHSGHLDPIIETVRAKWGDEAAIWDRYKTKNPPILELVTTAMDESVVTEEDVRALMTELVSIANYIQTEAIDKDKRIKVKNLPGVKVTGAEHNNYVGVDPRNPLLGTVSNSVRNAARQHQSVDAYVQATYGLPLKQVQQEFGKRRGDKSKISDDLKGALRDAESDAEEMVRWSTSQYEEHTGALHSIPDFRQQNLRGLFALIAYYLRMGKISIDNETKGLLKKKVGTFYYKTKLSTVRHQLTDNSISLDWLLTAHRKAVIEKLLQRTGRAAEQWVLRPMFDRKTGEPIDPIFCGPWLEQVLSGTDDKLFKDTVNPRSKELIPEERLSPGIILENRRFAQTQGRKNVKGRPARYAPEKWVGMAVKLYKYLKGLTLDRD